MTQHVSFRPRPPRWWRIVRAVVCGTVVVYFAGYQFWNLVHLAYGSAAAWTFVLAAWVGFPLAYWAGRTDVASWWCRGCADRNAVICYLERERESLLRTLAWWRSYHRACGTVMAVDRTLTTPIRPEAKEDLLRFLREMTDLCGRE
jgi:hypothetical protein